MEEFAGRRKRLESESPESGGDKNATRRSLEGTPFDTAEELRSAQSKIKMQVWKELEAAKAKKTLFAKSEFAHLLEPFDKGLGCKFGGSEENFVRVFRKSDGSFQIAIDETLKSDANSATMVEALVRSTSDSFMKAYFSTTGMINQPEMDDVIKRLKKEKTS
jgi:hypothetical protein